MVNENKWLPNLSLLDCNRQFKVLFILFIFVANLVAWLFLLLLSDGDIHTNPGPGSTNSTYSSIADNISLGSLQQSFFSFVHLNVQSLQYKLDAVYTEFCEFDILALSETWLNSSIVTDDLTLHSFHKPKRKDRASDSHGGIISYIKVFGIISEGMTSNLIVLNAFGLNYK